MPKYHKIICARCGEEALKASGKTNVKPKFCSRDCFNKSLEDALSNEIGEPIISAVSRLYVLERMSYRQISRKLKINPRTVSKYIKKSGVKTRHGGDAIKTQWENNDERRNKQSAMFRNIARLQSGKNHPRWTGGKKYDTSKESWMSLARKIRQRDKNKCTKCGISGDEHKKLYNRSLSVHHIVPFVLSNDNSPSNLKTLCIKCHRIVENQFKWLL